MSGSTTVKLSITQTQSGLILIGFSSKFVKQIRHNGNFSFTTNPRLYRTHSPTQLALRSKGDPLRVGIKGLQTETMKDPVGGSLINCEQFGPNDVVYIAIFPNKKSGNLKSCTHVETK